MSDVDRQPHGLNDEVMKQGKKKIAIRQTFVHTKSAVQNKF
jgi:hypothetical protein